MDNNVVNLNMLERVVVDGDLSNLSLNDRLMYYKQVCESLGLNPLTKPFDYLKLGGKITLYARKDATEQLRKIHGVSIQIVSRELVDDIYIVTAAAVDKSGRRDESIGAVSLSNLRGEAKANACMKAETKAKRRVTLSIAGLGLLDETEVDTIAGAKIESFDIEAIKGMDPQAEAPILKPALEKKPTSEVKSVGHIDWDSKEELIQRLQILINENPEVKERTDKWLKTKNIGYIDELNNDQLNYLITESNKVITESKPRESKNV